MTFDTLSARRATAELDVVVRELGILSERLLDEAAAARGLAAAVDWQARAATAFHEQAERWARAVSGLGCLAESARIGAARARDAAAAAIEGEPW